MARRLRSLECIGADGNSMHAPHLERVGEQQQLCLGVDRAALCVGGQPRAADLHLCRQWLCSGHQVTFKNLVHPTEGAVGWCVAARNGTT